MNEFLNSCPDSFNTFESKAKALPAPKKVPVYVPPNKAKVVIIGPNGSLGLTKPKEVKMPTNEPKKEDD